MTLQKNKIEPFNIIGISVRTSNNDGQSAKDIGALWEKFLSNKLLNEIPNKVNTSIYSIYTNYESDHTQPYTTILGCQVKNLDTVPEGMVGQSFPGGNYVQITAKGDLTKGIIYDEWLKIWQMDLKRCFTADFEVYGEKSKDPMDAEVDIFVGIF